MGLSKKSKPAQTKVIKCPLCGHEHAINVYNYTGFYLDGMHNLPVSKAMEMMVVCTACGLLYSAEDREINWRVRLRSQEYQQALSKQYPSVTEQKLALWDVLLHREYMPMYYAHYYREIGDREKEQVALQDAITAILSGKDNAKYNMHGIKWVNFNCVGQIVLTPDVRLVDLYRRTKQWDKALQQIEKVRTMEYMVTPYELFEYLKFEKRLITQKNSDIR